MSLRLRKIFSIFLVSAFLIGAYAPVASTPVASASIQGTGVAFTSCYAGGAIASWLESDIQKGLTKLKDKIAKMGSQFLKNLLGGAVNNLAGIGTTVPVTDANVADLQEKGLANFINKYSRDDIIARCLARQIINGITNNTNTIVRTRGRDGGVTFIKNWGNFQTQSQYRGENIFRAMLSTTNLCSYFSNDVKQSFGVKPNQKTPLSGQNTRTDSLQPYSIQAGCTLPKDFDINKFKQDFAGNGGWDTVARLAEPQNNPYGVLFSSLDEISKQRNAAQSADVNQALANRGYLGISGNGKSDSCRVKSPTGDCAVYKDIKTTGTYLADSVAAGIGAEYSWLTNTQELGAVIANATEVMLNRLLDQGSSDEGQYRIQGDGDPGVGPQPTPTPIAGLPTPPPGPICSPTSPQAGFLNVLISGRDNTQSLNFSSSAIVFGDTGYMTFPASNINNSLDAQRSDIVGKNYGNEITNIQRSLSHLQGVANDVAGVTFGLDKNHTLITQERTRLDQAKTDVLTALNNLINTVNNTCPTPTP